MDISKIAIKKEGEKQRDAFIDKEWKDARSQFYTNRIEQVINYSEKTAQQKQAIYQQFAKHLVKISTGEMIMPFGWLGNLQNYHDEIKQLQQEYNSTEKKYQQRYQQCTPILSILQMKVFTLAIINIQYQFKMDYRLDYLPPYSICAFNLFKVIWKNRNLSQVVLKGIRIQNFTQFIKAVDPCLNEEPQQTKDLSWIRHLNPSNIIKLAIDAHIEFNLQVEETIHLLNSLEFFIRIYPYLCDITARVILGRVINIPNREKILNNLWKQLRKILRIKIVILGSSYFDQIGSLAFPVIKFALFGGLASFKQISCLQFIDIGFSPRININNFLALQEILSNIFQNNQLLHLKLYYCRIFPIIPKVRNLQSIDISYVSFRKSFELMKQILRSSPKPKSIKGTLIDQQWSIEQNLFNEIQTLVSINCKGLTVNCNSSHSPSNIKHFIIQRSTKLADSFPVIFPKLFNLTYLYLSGVHFEQHLICTIPSPHLQILQILYSNRFLDEQLEAIDNKWPNLRELTIRQCANITQSVWGLCQFKGLMELHVDIRMVGKNLKELNNLRRKGVKVYCH